MFKVPTHAERVEQFRAHVAHWQQTGGDAKDLEFCIFVAPIHTTECHRILAEMGIR